MAEIRRNSRVADYIVEVDWRTIEPGSSDPSFRELVDRYEAGDLIVLSNVPLGVDYDLVNRITVPRQDGLRELSYKSFLYPRLWRSSQRRLMYGTFGLSVVDYWRFRQEVRRLNARIAELTRTIFSSYRFSKQQFSWRFLPTDLGIHPLHIDSFGSNDDLQYVRFFTNLDRQPRVWRVSHRLHELADRVYGRENWWRHAALPANQFCEVASRICYEDPDPDCHEISFAQGDVWFCDTRKISHGVVSGHRLMATHFWADPQSMQDPTKRLNQLVDDIHAGHAAAEPRTVES